MKKQAITKKEQIGDYVSRAYVQQYLSVSSSTVYRWTRSGKLKKYQLGGSLMYDINEVNNLIQPTKQTN